MDNCSDHRPDSCRFDTSVPWGRRLWGINMSRRTPLLALLLSASLGLIACTGSVDGAAAGVSASAAATSGTVDSSAPSSAPSGRPASSAASPPSSTPAKPAAPQKVWQRLWQKQDNPMLGQPVAVGKHVVVYTSTHEVPYLDIVDPTSGRSIWRTATGGWWNSGVRDFQPAVIGTKVAFTQTDQLTLSSTRVGVVDVTTRKVVYSSAVKGSLSRVWACGTTFCVGETVGDVDRMATVDPRTARITVAAGLGTGDQSSVDNSGLISIARKGAASQFALLRNGRVLWKKSQSSILGIKPPEDAAYSVSYLPAQRLLVGSLDDISKDGRISAASRTFAIDATDGQRKWVKPGYLQFCFDPFGLSVAARAALTCTFSKDTRYGSTQQKFTAGTVSVAALDLATGRPRSSIVVGRVAGLKTADLEKKVRAVSAGSALVTAGTGVVLDLANGVRRATRNDKALCHSVIESTVWPASTQGVGVKPLRETGDSVATCDKTGTRTTQTTALPSTVGATIGSNQLFTIGRTLVAGTMTTATVTTRTIRADAESPVPARLPVTAATAARWTARGFIAASQPVIAGDRALVYGTVKGTFSLIGVDVASGKLVWSKPASLAGVLGGLHRPAVVGSRALVMVPVPGYTLVRPAIVDTATGRELVRPAGELILKSSLERCGDLICTVLGVPDGGFVSVHFDLQSGSAEIEPTDEVHTSMTAVAPDVYLTKDGTTQTILGTSRGWNRFQVPASSIIPAGRVLSSVSIAPAVDDVYVRGLGLAIRSDGAYPLINRGRDIGLVGISATTGNRIWALRGSDRDCLDTTVSDAGAPIVCTWGAAAKSQYSNQGSTHTGLTVALQGIDLKTGWLSRWKVPLKQGAGVQTSGSFGMADETHAIVPGPKGPLSIDVNTGRAVRATSSTPRLCGKTVEAETGNIPTDSNPVRETYWPVGESWSWCDEDGNEVGANKAWPSWIGAHTTSMTIVLTDKGLQGFPRA
ncbi:hypothetical protein ABLG96_01230 [Nakamurella sp. A5-74]|uniref:PQQ-binding-like beta-propeller repeat protein n=1 Tax=Nakamurella sp. A5-74 TaxID=3158264 RepID=A0AAU8DQD6_9ACTN